MLWSSCEKTQNIIEISGVSDIIFLSNWEEFAAMEMGRETPRKNEAAGQADWSAAFVIGDARPEFSRLATILAVTHRDIYTGRLPKTIALSSAIIEGSASLIGTKRGEFGFAEIMDILGLAITHSRLARTRVATLASPGFWSRDPNGQPRPAFPIAHLCTMTGLTEVQIRPILNALAMDGALRLLHSQSGVQAIMVQEGFAPEDGVARFLAI